MDIFYKWTYNHSYYTHNRTAKIGGGAKQLTERQRKSLYQSQLLEFKRRYGKKVGADRRAEMLLCENSQQQLMGVAAVEVETIPEFSLTSMSRTRAPLMSNVAVSKRWRRRGIAEMLVKEIERLVRLQWGYDDIYLYVEERNKPAIRLYQKLGYKRYWSDNTAKTLLPSTSGGMTNEPTTIVCMRKRLTGGGIFGRLFGWDTREREGERASVCGKEKRREMCTMCTVGKYATVAKC